jgi:hypothetical protein
MERVHVKFECGYSLGGRMASLCGRSRSVWLFHYIKISVCQLEEATGRQVDGAETERVATADAMA